MKKKALNKTLGACVVSAALCSVGTGNVLAQDISSGIFDTPFDRCFADGYNLDQVDKEQAFKTAECFTSLLESGADNLGASQLTIMQYSASWYEAAAEKGHEEAQSKFDTNLIALNDLEQKTYQVLFGNSQQMLASEVKFQAMDVNKDGLLSVSEAPPSLLAKSDIDRDGVLSYGEYTINSGEATAAGH